MDVAFSFSGEIYVQHDGVAMGSRLGLALPTFSLSISNVNFAIKFLSTVRLTIVLSTIRLRFVGTLIMSYVFVLF